MRKMKNGLVVANYNDVAKLLEMKEDGAMTPYDANIYGRCSIFDCCSTGDIFGMQIAVDGFFQWLGFRANRYYMRFVDFIPWIGPVGSHGSRGDDIPETGAGAPCEDPKGWEFGHCGYYMTHESWYHRAGNALDPHTIVQDRCETSPKYRLNGVQIADDVEWQMNGIMNVMSQDIRRDLVHGSHLNAWQMNGLESIVKTGYTNYRDGSLCPDVDSIIVNWSDDLEGENNDLGNFFEYLDEVVNEIEARASALGTISQTDMILLTNRFMATCLLDAYACYTICGATEMAVSEVALRAEARKMRRDLNGGPLYDGKSAVGYITLKSGRQLPIVVDDALDISYSGSNIYCTDIYLLTRRIGSIDVLYGEYLDLREYENRVKKQMPNFTARADSAGRFVFKGKETNWCMELMMGTSPEIYLSAPWAQARFEGVCCSKKRKPQSSDMFQPEYLPGGRPLYYVHDECTNHPWENVLTVPQLPS
jgi:hypothetical protein